MVMTIIILLSAILLYYIVVLWKDISINRSRLKFKKISIAVIIGFITDFFDTFGIGSFATTTFLFNAVGYLESDKKLPGTLNVGHTVPQIIASFLFISVVKVEPLTFFSLVIAAIVGARVATSIVIQLSEKKIQLAISIALILTACLMFVKQIGWIDILGQGNVATGLTGIRLVIGIVGNFILGGIMTFGVGLYAPCMAMVYMLGLNPLVAFPIMMASCAGIMPVAGTKFIKNGEYSRNGVIGIMFGGVMGLFIAVRFIDSLEVSKIVWIVIIVVLYTGISMLIKNLKGKKV